MVKSAIGHDAYVQYGKETAYGTATGTTDTAFGHNLTIGVERKNNMLRVMDLSKRNAQKIQNLAFDGNVTLDFSLGTTHWLGAVMGSAATTGSAPYIHTYSESDTLPSVTIEHGFDLDTDSVITITSFTVNECSISMNVGEPITANLNGPYKTETRSSSGLDATPAIDAEEVFIFAEGSLECPSGTTVADIQSAELRVSNDLKQTRGLGSRFLTQCPAGARTYEVTLSGAFESHTNFLTKFYGNSTGPQADVDETATLVLNATNGLTGASERQLRVTLTGVQFDTESLPSAPNEQVFEGLTAFARAGSIIGEDNQDSTIFD